MECGYGVESVPWRTWACFAGRLVHTGGRLAANAGCCQPADGCVGNPYGGGHYAKTLQSAGATRYNGAHSHTGCYPSANTSGTYCDRRVFVNRDAHIDP